MRNICVVVASRANYGRVKSLMVALKESKTLNLQLIVSASTLLYRFGEAVKVIKEDGFEPDMQCAYVVEGENLETQAKSTGLGIIELSSAFKQLRPDAVVTVADRFETMATAISATYMNIPLIHIQGGEVSGNIDDRVRHAITQLADIHFPATEASKSRIISMGKPEESIFNVGCPAMDLIDRDNTEITPDIRALYKGVGDEFDWDKPYILVVLHPVTTSFGESYKQTSNCLEALLEIDIQKLILWPNADAGSDMTAKAIRDFRESKVDINMTFVRNFSPEHYVKILANAKCLVGNSSSFIREGCYLGKRAILIGDRQLGRESGDNVTLVGHGTREIAQAIRASFDNDIISPSNLFGNGSAGILMCKILEKLFK